MTISMYQASIPVFTRNFDNLIAILRKAEANAAERKVDTTVLLNYRLAPDMFTLTRQVQIATDVAKGCAARLVKHPAVRPDRRFAPTAGGAATRRAEEREPRFNTR